VRRAVKRAATLLLIAGSCALAWYAPSRLLAQQRRIQIFTADSRAAAGPRAEARQPATIRVATFNIAHARGGEFGASNWTGASKAEVRSRLAKIARQVSDARADVLVLNEVDFQSSWSRSIDQAAEIAGATGLVHVLEQRNVDVALPFRTFRFGNAILSRYPIARAEAIRFPPYSRWEAALAGNHDGVVAEVLTPLGRVRVVAVHLEYRSEEVRLRCARIIETLAEGDARPWIVMGDFNSIPAFARRHPGYAPAENAVDLLLRGGKLSASKAATGWEHYVTFPSASPDRAIDWILTSHGLDQGVPAAIRSDLSDHLMVVVPVSAPLRSE
jgi:endonuclease/exonuclease/phosphatase family metal-dependent hydrolase